MRGAPRERAAELGLDGVIRFEDADHFLEELAGRLGRGQAFVRSTVAYPLNEPVMFELEAPVVRRRLTLPARVVFARNGHLGLELERFDDLVPKLDALGSEVERAASGPVGSSAISFDEDDEAETGKMEVPAHLRHEPSDGATLDATFSAYLAELDARTPKPRGDTSLDPPPFEGEDEDPFEGEDEDEVVPPPALDPSISHPAVADLVDDEPTPVHLSSPMVPPPEGSGEAVSPGEEAAEPSSADDPEEPAAPAASETPPSLDEATASSTETPDHGCAASDASEKDEAADEADAPEPAAEDVEAEAPSETPEPADDGAEAETPLEPAEPADDLAEAPSVPADDLVPSTEEEARPEAEAEAEPEPSAAAEPPAEPLEPELAPSPPVAAAAPEPRAASESAASLAAFAAERASLESAPLFRASPGGVVRFQDAAQLLGAWLTGLAAGHLTVWGGPEGEAGRKVPIKIFLGRVVTLEALVIARIGPWLTVEVDDVEPIRELLVENADAWRSSIDRLAPPPSTLPAPSSAPHVAPLSSPALAVSPRSSTGLRGVPAVVALPVADGPARPPRLEDGVVRFGNAGDLDAEMKANLANGGLFVESAPLALNTRHRLSLWVGEVELPDIVEANVVFASGGKVGFSVAEAGQLCKQLGSYLEQGGVPRSDVTPPPPHDVEVSGPTVEQVGRLDAPPAERKLLDLSSRRGELRTVSSAIELFDELVYEKFRGVVTFVGPGAQRKAFLHQGNVAFLDAQPFDESTALGQILSRHRKVSPQALKTALDEVRSSGAPLGRALVGRGQVRPTDVTAALRQQTRVRLEAAFEWSGGHYELSQWTEPPGSGDLVVTRGLGILVHYLRSRFAASSKSTLEAALGSTLQAALQGEEELDAAIKSLGLGPKETRFLQVTLDGRRSLQDAIQVSGLTRSVALELAATGLSLGFLSVSEPSMGTNPVDDRVLRELQERSRALEGQNHFEVLGVHWTAHPRTFQQALDTRKSELGLPSGAPEEARELARSLLEKYLAAHKTLSDETQRISYRRKLFDKTDREYAARMLVDKGEVASMRGAKLEAIEFFETANEIASSERIRSLLKAARARLR